MSETQPKSGPVSIVIPVYNEAGHIESSLKNVVSRLQKLSLDFELLVVESGSTDETRSIVRGLSAADGRIRLLCEDKRNGMGSAISLGFKNATGDYLFWMDCDSPYDLKYLSDALIMIKNCDVVAGYRKSRSEGFKRKLYSWVFNAFVNLFFSLGLKDINFSFKLFKRGVFKNVDITSKSSFFAAEILIKCARRGYMIKQLAVEYVPRSQGKSKLGNLRTVFHILKEMLNFVLFGRSN